MTKQTCPHCKRDLVLFLDLGFSVVLQCPDDFTVHTFSKEADEPDLTLATLACPTGKCD